MAEKKITKREVITAMLKEEVVLANEVYKAYLENELALLNKKAENKKPTKEQAENVERKAEILNVLTDKGATVTDIMGKSEVLKALSNQRVSALLRQLIDEGKVVKETEGKKSLFRLA